MNSWPYSVSSHHLLIPALQDTKKLWFLPFWPSLPRVLRTHFVIWGCGSVKNQIFLVLGTCCCGQRLWFVKVLCVCVWSLVKFVIMSFEDWGMSSSKCAHKRSKRYPPHFFYNVHFFSFSGVDIDWFFNWKWRLKWVTHQKLVFNYACWLFLLFVNTQSLSFSVGILMGVINYVKSWILVARITSFPPFCTNLLSESLCFFNHKSLILLKRAFFSYLLQQLFTNGSFPGKSGLEEDNFEHSNSIKLVSTTLCYA